MNLLEGSTGKRYLCYVLRTNGVARHHLGELGVVDGSVITVLARNNHGDIIIKIMDTRLALTAELAKEVRIIEYAG